MTSWAMATQEFFFLQIVTPNNTDLCIAWLPSPFAFNECWGNKEARPQREFSKVEFPAVVFIRYVHSLLRREVSGAQDVL